jgi:hypothetical protein
MAYILHNSVSLNSPSIISKWVITQYNVNDLCSTNCCTEMYKECNLDSNKCRKLVDKHMTYTRDHFVTMMFIHELLSINTTPRHSLYPRDESNANHNLYTPYS